MYPGRRNPLFTEDGIQAAIFGNMEAIEARKRPAVLYRAPYKSFKKHPKYTGFMALYVHYLYVLGKIEKQQYPPRMTPRLRKEVMRSERYREQFVFLRENGIATQEDMAAFQVHIDWAKGTITIRRNAQYTPAAGVYVTSPKNGKPGRESTCPAFVSTQCCAFRH